MDFSVYFHGIPESPILLLNNFTNAMSFELHEISLHRWIIFHENPSKNQTLERF